MEGIVSRAEAYAVGQYWYFTGKPCKHGHIARRQRSNGNCAECFKTVYCETVKASSRKYRKRNGKRRREHERNGSGKVKWLARARVYKAIKSGRLKKRPCERCGSTHLIHAHHDDYLHPLDVIWLCPLHHAERHRDMDHGVAA